MDFRKKNKPTLKSKNRMNIRKVYNDPRVIMLEEKIAEYTPLMPVNESRDFMRIANEINEKYGMNVAKTKDASSFKRIEKAPHYTGLLRYLWG